MANFDELKELLVGQPPEALVLIYGTMMQKYKEEMNPNFLIPAMEVSAQAVSGLAEDHVEMAAWMERLTFAFTERYRHTREAKALTTLVGISDLVLLHLSGDPQKDALARIRHLQCLLVRYEHLGVEDGLEEGLRAARQAIDGLDRNDPAHSIFASVYGERLFLRFQRTGNIRDLNEVIALGREQLENSGDSQWMTRMSTCLESQYRHTNNLRDLDEAIDKARQALAAQTNQGTHSLQIRLHISGLLGLKSSHNGSTEDLNASIRTAEEAVELAAQCNSREVAKIQAGLGTSLLRRYEKTGNLEDLKRAIACSEQGVSLNREGDGNRVTRLINLGGMKLRYFERTRDLRSLEEAIAAQRSVLSETAEKSLERASALSNLASSLRCSFEATGNSEFIDAAITNAQEAVEITDKDSSNLFWRLDTLGGCFLVRYRLRKFEQDLDQAITIFRRANSAAPDNNHISVAISANLAISLHYKSEIAQSTTHRDEALVLILKTVNCTMITPWRRVLAARIALRYLIPTQDWSQAEAVLKQALPLLSEACNRHLSREDQQRNVRLASGLAADACSLSLLRGRVEEALQRAEAGRGIILGHLMDGTADLAALREHHQEIAENYETIRENASQPIESDDFVVREDMFRKREQARQNMTRLEEEIRRIRGFEHFLRFPPIKAIQACAAEGPIVVVNITDIRSDAIVIAEGSISTVQLHPGTSEAPSFFLRDLANYRSADATIEDRNFVLTQQDDDAMEWLWTTCVKPVLANLPQFDDLTRVWWIGSGIASSMPFHAAGLYHRDIPEEQDENCLARTIPSYAPTIKVLMHAKARASTQAREERKHSFLSICMEKTPGASDLHGVIQEQKAVSEVVRHTMDVRRMQNPTAQQALAEITRNDIAHFACHGFSDPLDPSESFLLLQKRDESGNILGEVDKVTVAALLDAKNDGKARWIAYLSACSTATVTEKRYTDEGLHLANAFQVAGYTHVIGSMWPVKDQVCVEVARSFYSNLVALQGEEERNRVVALALRNAVMELRSKMPHDFRGWAPYVHWGV